MEPEHLGKAPAGHEHHEHHPKASGSTAAASAEEARRSQVVHASHDKHAGHSVEMFRQKFLGTLLLSIPTLVWAPMIQQWFGYAAPGGPGASRWIPASFGALVYAHGGLVFVKGVVTIMVLGHWIEMRSISQAQGAVKELAKLLPDTAQRISGDRIEDVPVSSPREGDLVLVRPGASVPADGIVREGASDVNESMITGESRPVPKKPGDKLIAGTVNGSGSLRIEVTGTGEKTALAGIMQRRGDPACGGRPCTLAHRAAPGDRRGADVPQHRGRGGQRAAAAARTPVTFSPP
jgi:Cu2+-exporting ATPase